VVKEVVAKCNVCGATEDVEEFTIIRAGEAREVDACAEHRAPLVELYETGEAPQKAAPPQRSGDGRRGGNRHSIVPIEDWQKPGS
jgi:hypothetical protein